MRVKSVGHEVFAATFIALGILGLAKGSFTPVWEPVPKGIPGREALVYLRAIISLLTGIGLLWQRTAAVAARILFASLALWIVVLRVPRFFLAPVSQNSWSGFGETAVMIAGALVLCSWFADNDDREHLAFDTADKGLRIARMLLGVALIIFCEAHFRFARETGALVPSWLSFHLIWVYLTAFAFVAAGLAVLFGICARLAASLSALQIGLFTALVWVPIVAKGSRDPFVLSETILSWAITTVHGWLQIRIATEPGSR